jgi:hypothetical protein
MMQASRYKILLEAIESFVRNAFNVQVLDEPNIDYGGFRCPDHLVCEPLSAINAFTTMTILFLNPKSQYYHSPDLLKSMKMAFQFINRSLNDDGSMNIYFSGEMKTKSNLVFVINTLIKSYRLLLKDNTEEDLHNQLGTLIKKGIDTLKSFPTENSAQKLAIASVLIDFDKLFFDRPASDKAMDYLTDRLDINHDGMYNDRSLNSSMLSNAMLLNVAKKTNKIYLIDYVRRNLNFTLYNLRQNGEFAPDCMMKMETEKAPTSAYSIWKEMSIIDHNGYYATAGDMLVDSFLNSIKDGFAHCHSDMPDIIHDFRDYSRFLLTSSVGELLLVEDELNNDSINRLPLPNHYEKTFANSNIARIKNGKMNATVMAGRNLFSLENGQVVINHFGIRYKYYGYHDFIPKRLELTSGSYILRDWFRHTDTGSESGIIDISQANLIIQAEFAYRYDHFEILVSATGERGVAFLLEFGTKRVGVISIGDKECDFNNTNLISMDSKEAIIKAGDDVIRICGGMVQHRIYCKEDLWVRDIQNVNIVVTPIVPFTTKFQIFLG